MIHESGTVQGKYDFNSWRETLWQSNPTLRLSYIDKEKDKESGLGDFGVRKYEDGYGRFLSIDPLWESYRNLSPYNYSANNPLLLKDPGGKAFNGGPLIQPAQTSEFSSSKTERKARSAGDAPHGSSHLEESFKKSVANTISLPGKLADAALTVARVNYAADLIKNEVITPDFIQVSVGGGTFLGTGGGATSNQTLLTSGPEIGEWVGTNTTLVGGGLDMSLSASLVMGWFIPANGDFSDHSGITAESLLGKSDNISLGGSALGRLGWTGGVSPTTGGTWIMSGITVGASYFSTGISGSVTIGDTKPNE